MGVARDQRATDLFSLSLAGLQAGMAAALLMLAWLGITAAWRQSSFWTAENLWASTFYGPSAIHRGFSTSTLSGLALYLLVYSLLGGLFAVALRGTLSRSRMVLVSIALAVGWYYLSFHVIWHTVSPLVALLHSEQPTLFGHVIYGTAVAQFPSYLSPGGPPQPEVPAVAAVAESAPGPHPPEP